MNSLSVSCRENDIILILLLAALTLVFQANVAMGIQIPKTMTNEGNSAFSQDILKIEIYGPIACHSLCQR